MENYRAKWENHKFFKCPAQESHSKLCYQPTDIHMRPDWSDLYVDVKFQWLLL
jgi:hypothetical protein